MNVSAIKDDCMPCSIKNAVAKKNIGIFSGVLMALLPKCPFCFMAFSGTLMLCRNGTEMSSRTFSSTSTIIIAALLCVAVLLSILFNYRDARTKYASLIVLAGSAMIILSVSVAGGLTLYYTGVFLVFTGVWLNASLLFFVNKITSLVTTLLANLTRVIF